MNFGNFFKRIRTDRASKKDAPNHWIKCKGCQSLMYYKEVAKLNYVCPKCNYHMQIDAKNRLNLLIDKDSFTEFDTNLSPTDPLKFVDKKSYKKRIEEGFKKVEKKDAIISGECKIDGEVAQIVIFDFAFMGGSLGSVEGEKIVRAVNRAIESNCGLVIVSASGGARMQESTYSLMQMAKTSTALAKLSDKKLPYISILTNPTMGGVSASFSMLGDIIIAEPNALIGFAGPRVIKQTIGAELPEGFQKSEFLLEKGLVDMVVDRGDLKKRVADLLKMLRVDEN